MNMSETEKLYHIAKRIIPGGTQLLSKRPEMFLPGKWPAYYSKAKGCEVWDLDGNKYYDTCIMGVGACVLGYAFDEVDEAAREAIARGSMCTLNAPEEVELAEKLLQLHPWEIWYGMQKPVEKQWRWLPELHVQLRKKILFLFVAIMAGMTGILLPI